MSEYIRKEIKKELSRKELLVAVRDFLKIAAQFSDPGSIVFHSSSALCLLEDLISFREKKFNPLSLEEKITNDIDIWMSRETMESLLRYLKYRNIRYKVEEEKEQFTQGQRSSNLTFTLNTVSFDIWSRDSRFVPDGVVVIDMPIDKLLFAEGSEVFPIKVLTKEALVEHYRHLYRHELSFQNPKASQRVDSMQRASKL